MARETSPNAIRYEVYQEGLHDISSHIVSCTSNRNTIKHRVTPFADGDPFLVDVCPLMEAVAHHRTPTKLEELSHLAKRYRVHASSLKEEDARLQEDIMDMMVRLAQIRSELVEVENRLDMTCNSMSPVRLLPAEILEVIFLAVVAESDQGEWPQPKSSPQIALSQVCSDWRRISLQLPCLWSRFLFDIGVPSRENRHPLQETFSHLDVWLNRSRPLPFAICLHATSHFPLNSDGPYYHTILQTIADRAASRIEVLRVHLDSPMLLASTAWSQMGSVKRLELFSSDTRNDLSNRTPLPCTAFEQLPSLTSFHFDVTPASPFHFPVSFASLTEVEVGESSGGIDAFVLNYLLRCCPKLIRGGFFLLGAGGRGGSFFSGYIPDSVLDSNNRHHRFALQELEALALKGKQFAVRTALMELEIPRLRTLELRLWSTIGGPILEASRITFNSLRSIRTLSISCILIEDLDEFRVWLELLHNLQHLKCQVQYDTKLFRMLTIEGHEAHTPLLPNLRRFSTWVWDMRDDERKDFWNMYRSRSKRAEQLDNNDSVSRTSQFLIDAFVDSTKLNSADVPDILQADNPGAKHSVRFHIVSPFTPM